METDLTPLSAAALLQAWENGRGYPPAQQALFLLAAAYPQQSLQSLAELPIGRRDRLLLHLRRRLFGSRLESLVVCPLCGERLELSIDLADVEAPETGAEQDAWELARNGYHLRFRLPNSLDLIAAQAREGPQADARLHLLQSCLLELSHADSALTPAQLPDAVQEAVAQRLAELDPQADVRFPLTCPVCAHGWEAVFDIVSFLWQELHNWALRLLGDVHTLAMAYAWREADILALSPWRRHYYLEMVSG